MSGPISSSPTTGTVEGFCYEKKVYGVGANSYDTTCIFIPSRNLSVSGDGTVFKIERPFTSKKADTVKEEYLDECYSNKRPYNESELEALRSKADEDARKMVKVSLEVVEEIDTLVEQKAQHEAKILAINANIKRLSQRLF